MFGIKIPGAAFLLLLLLLLLLRHLPDLRWKRLVPCRLHLPLGYLALHQFPKFRLASNLLPSTPYRAQVCQVRLPWAKHRQSLQISAILTMVLREESVREPKLPIWHQGPH